MIEYIVQDWAANDVFEGHVFNSWDDGEDYLCEFFDTNKMDYDEWRQEYEIVEHIRETF